ncbi:glycine cleavage system protein GcvH [soil metagenome]
MEFVRYKQAHFSARFPADYLYAPSHYWMAPTADAPGTCRVGFTKFATRMLGELVEAQFEVKPGEAVSAGQAIGYVEGFKAASDVFSSLGGTFAGGNPTLAVDACIVRSSPYTDGWLYAVEGTPPADALDVHQYIDLLDATINRMAAEQEHQEA